MSTVYQATFASPMGRMTLLSTEQGLCFVGLPGATPSEVGKFISKYFPGAQIKSGGRHNKKAAAEIVAYLKGTRKKFTVSLDLKAEGFSRKALNRVKAIPYGKTRTYGQIALSLGNSKAARAVGAANAANPIPIIIPCHRVVARQGLGGYGGGVALKRKLLALEKG